MNIDEAIRTALREEEVRTESRMPQLDELLSAGVARSRRRRTASAAVGVAAAVAAVVTGVSLIDRSAPVQPAGSSTAPPATDGLGAYEQQGKAIAMLERVKNDYGDTGGILDTEIDGSRAVVYWDDAVPLPQALSDLEGSYLRVTSIAATAQERRWSSGQLPATKDSTLPGAPSLAGLGYDLPRHGFTVMVRKGSGLANMTLDEVRQELNLPAPVLSVTEVDMPSS